MFISWLGSYRSGNTGRAEPAWAPLLLNPLLVLGLHRRPGESEIFIPWGWLRWLDSSSLVEEVVVCRPRQFIAICAPLKKRKWKMPQNIGVPSIAAVL